MKDALKATSKVTIFDKRKREKIDYQAVIKAAEIIHDNQKKREIIQATANIKIDTTKPVAIFTQGDLHIGNADVNYYELIRQHDKIRTTHNAFVCFTGDLLDNAFIFRDGGWNESLPYDMQGEVAANLLKDLDLREKILWNITGNHDAFQPNSLPTYFADMNFPIIGPNHGTINLQIGDQKYIFFAFHKSSMGSSTASPFLRCQRVTEYMCPTADVIIGGHSHVKAVAQYGVGIDEQHKTRVMIETGTFKPNEKFQREQGNLRTSQFDVGGAGVILFPNKREIIPFYDFDNGIAILNKLTK